MNKNKLQPGDVVQVTEERDGLVGAFLMVTEVKSWGVQGFVHHVKSFEEFSQIFLRLTWERFEPIGHGVMIPASILEELGDE